ncbi:BaiN/RdsA family NAD(P)/FAD-dependent oxidoreductase [Robiginitomaculum antarcticum]|uniref:NAD(P)/FAD-dependent oxidoreductase n=1 Tax=Robiginitomaculum antarcticum TaxID=437507 RepID=UPI00037662B5|nr:NAD(P)/FAD-dependent oxidoreductase [Robiginitomaculum antarcticum]
MNYDVIIIGAGAAGLFCAGQAGKRGRRVLLLDHSAKPAEKVRISGGGRCNFTNLYCGPDNFISANPHFAKSALSRYSPHDFIALVEQYGISWHEKHQTGMQLGQLFCDESSQQIIDLLLTECKIGGVEVKLSTTVNCVSHDGRYSVETSAGTFTAAALVIATGGLSIPKMGATNFGYKIAAQFGVTVTPRRAGLVPLTFTGAQDEGLKALAGTAAPARVSCEGASFDEAILLTHRGMSGPAILQISSYLEPGEAMQIALMDGAQIEAVLLDAKTRRPKSAAATVLAEHIPKRLAEYFTAHVTETRLADMTDEALRDIASTVGDWALRPAGSEGYRKAEVTLGGVDTHALNSKTMMANDVTGLYFIGEVVDVTGHLGGHNFQWAWASAYACAQSL